MKNKELTIYDIAKALSLSPSTVSRALKENKRISAKTQERVIAYAQQNGYQAHTFAANLRTGQTKTIGVLVPRLNSKFIANCLAGAEKIAAEKGYSLLIGQAHEDTDKEIKNARSMFTKRVDGLLVSTVVTGNNTSHFKPFVDKGVPVLFFDRTPQSGNFPVIEIDNYAAGKQAAEHLLNIGCKTLVHITHNSGSSVYKQRQLGFEQTAQAAHVSYKTISTPNLTIEGGRQVITEINLETTDGIFVANDQAAAGLMTEIKHRGLQVPHNTAIVGFNNDPVCEVVSPTLTTINYPAYQMGTLMANQLIEHILGNADMTITHKTTLKSELIVRGSTQKNIM